MNTDPIRILLQRLLLTKENIIVILERNNVDKYIIEQVENIFYEDYGL